MEEAKVGVKREKVTTTEAMNAETTGDNRGAIWEWEAGASVHFWDSPREVYSFPYLSIWRVH
jgi:hypothetical protein